MNKYRVKITETLSKEIELLAESEEDARTKAEEKYYNCEIVLNSEDFVECEMVVFK